MGEVEEIAGRAPFAVLIAPAHQHFQRIDDAGAEIDLGLERAADAPVADRRPQARLKPTALQLSALHFRIEGARPRARLAPRLGERRARFAPNAVGRDIVARPYAQARFGRSKDFDAFDEEGIGEARDNAPDGLAIAHAARRGRQDEAKFVAARSTEPILGAKVLGDALGDALEQRIARRSIEGVDLGELLDFDHSERKRLSRPARVGEIHHRAVAEVAVGQRSEGIEIGALVEFVLQLLLRVDLEGDADAPALAAKFESASFDPHRPPVERTLFAVGRVRRVARKQLASARIGKNLGARRVADFERQSRDFQRLRHQAEIDPVAALLIAGAEAFTF